MDRNRFRYAANYCEENVWHLCQADELALRPRSVCVIASLSGVCEFFRQRAGAEGAPVAWDYHVVLLVGVAGSEAGAPWQVWDLDTRCDFPCDADDYWRQTFPRRLPDLHLWAPRFRLFPAETYAARLASDRSHMRTSDGDWLAPPPPWPPIGDPARLTLSAMLDVSSSAIVAEGQHAATSAVGPSRLLLQSAMFAEFSSSTGNSDAKTG